MSDSVSVLFKIGVDITDKPPSPENMSDSDKVAHVALFPGAGMGHLTPFLRLAAFLVKRHCRVTLIVPENTVSNAESKRLSRFHSAFPHVTFLRLHLLPLDASSAKTTDPFFLQFESIRRSSHLLLPPLLASISPPLSAFVCDVLLVSPVLRITESLCIPFFVLFTSSAIMTCLFSRVTNFVSSISDLSFVEIPGVSDIPRSSVPPLYLIPNNVFANIAIEDSPNLLKSHGILINSFESLEPKTLEALNSGKAVKDFPHVFAIGPLLPCEFEKDNQKQGISPAKWLEDQPPESVVYVSFGSRLSMGREQIREIGNGLLKSGFKFIWVLKDKKVDREEEDKIEEVVGLELMERLKSKGLVMKEWVDQNEILSHKSVGGFVSHCGWNSTVEAAWHGVPILGWPQIGDQKLNAEVAERGGWGMWKREWGWSGERVVKGDEIGEAIEEMMKNQNLRKKAQEMKEEAKKAIRDGGSSETSVQKLIDVWRKKKTGS